MSTGLISLPGVTRQQASQPLSTMTAEQLADLIGPWLPRFQLFTSNSGAVKDRLIPAGHWGIPVTPSTVIDLGAEVDIVLAASRDKALLTADGEFQASTDRTSALYQKIRDLALTDSDSGAMFGTEFLAWIGPQQLFATLFLGSASARRESFAFMQAVDKPAQVHSRLVGKNPRKRWEVPLIRITEAFPFDLPTEESISAAWTKFTKPDTEAEVAPETAGGRVR